MPPPRRIASRGARSAVLVALLGGVALIALGSILLGSNHLPLAAVIQAVLSPGTGGEAVTIVRDVRVPRTVVGLLVGVCLGVAGAVMQGHTRNPLADPGLFGVSAGAGLAVALSVFAFGVTDTGTSVWFALVGALIASVTVFAVTATGSDTASPVPLAIAGAAVSALLGAFTSFIVLADRTTLDVYRRWVVGSLSGRDLDVAVAVLPFALVGLALAVVNAGAIDALGLGGEMARGLGEHVLAARLIGLASITLLTSAATAAAGPIGFLGLVVPHVARAVVGVGHRWLLPAAGLLGAILVLGADIVGRLIGGFGEVQVGIVLAVIGGPVFIAVARRRSLVAL